MPVMQTAAMPLWRRGGPGTGLLRPRCRGIEPHGADTKAPCYAWGLFTSLCPSHVFRFLSSYGSRGSFFKIPSSCTLWP